MLLLLLVLLLVLLLRLLHLLLVQVHKQLQLLQLVVVRVLPQRALLLQLLQLLVHICLLPIHIHTVTIPWRELLLHALRVVAIPAHALASEHRVALPPHHVLPEVAHAAHVASLPELL